MTDKPDWEFEIYETLAGCCIDGEHYDDIWRKLQPLIVSAASAQLEAAVARAKREVLEGLAIRAANIAGLTNGDLTDGLHAAWKEARAKYSEPTAVAATEKEG